MWIDIYLIHNLSKSITTKMCCVTYQTAVQETTVRKVYHGQESDFWKKVAKEKVKKYNVTIFLYFLDSLCYFLFPKMSLLCPTTKLSLSHLFQPPIRYQDKGGLICHIDTTWPLTFICCFLNLGSDISVVQSPHTQNALDQVIESTFNIFPKRGFSFQFAYVWLKNMCTKICF